VFAMINIGIMDLNSLRMK